MAALLQYRFWALKSRALQVLHQSRRSAHLHAQEAYKVAIPSKIRLISALTLLN
jgi:hypothetical protein